MKPIIVHKNSWMQWPQVVVMWWVHGNEKTGIAVVEECIQSLEPEKWSLVLCIANPLAIERNVRAIDMNLNRAFVEQVFEWNEWDIATILKPYIQNCDYLLDLHNTITPWSQPFLISEYSKYCQYFDVKYVLSWLDTLHPWWTDGYANALWKKWLCLECGSIYADESKAFELWYSSVRNFLRVVWMLPWQPVQHVVKHTVHAEMIYTTKTNRFLLERAFEDFENLIEWTLIWYDWEVPIVAPYDGVILFPYNQVSAWSEGFVYGRVIK